MMRKGTEKRQNLLDTAEKLFCQQGYEKTSVQDILDATSMSKGGFYHHFASKDEVMTALCSRRAERAAAFAADALNAAGTPAARINAVLYGFMPLRRDEADFAAMLLPVISKPECRAVALIYQDALEEHFLPLLKAAVASAASVGAVYPPVREMEKVILNTVNQCWIAAAQEAWRCLSEGHRIDQTTLLGMMEKYRRAIEVLLDAPYGTIEIVRVEELDEVFRNIV